jgi:hypothetical protein
MSLAAWMASVTDPATSAKRELARLPESETRHGAKVPWTFRDRREYKRGLTSAQIRQAIRSAPVVRIRLDDPRLYSIQHSVSPERVREYIDDPDLAEGRVNETTQTPADIPVVMQAGGDRYFHDGNHRATAAYLEGVRSMSVRLVDVDAMRKQQP